VTTLETIATRAAKANLACLLAGGHAVIVHGHPRSTFDLDLVVRREDREGWLRLARDMGYELFHEGKTFLQFNATRAEGLPLDLMIVNEDTFAKLMAEAVPAPPATADVKVVSLRHLLALKCHAIKHGHAGRIEKDLDDVIRLVEVNRLDIGKPEIRDLFLKHGTRDLYEKVQQVCGQA
jgi:hypothetical protein